FNTSITSLKALDEGYTSKNYVRKFLRALHPKWRAKATTIEESKDLTSLSLDELIRTLKVHVMIIKKDSEIVKAKGERKSFALKANKESSDEESLTSRSKDEEYTMAIRDFKKFFKKRGKNQKAFIGDSWSDSGERDDEKAKDKTCLMAHASSEIHSESSYFSDASTSGTKKTEFVKSQNEMPSDGGPLIAGGGPRKVQTAPTANQGLPLCSSENGKFVYFQKSIFGPRPNYITVNNVKIPVASDDKVKRFYKPSLKLRVGFSKPKFR
ncbi:hypothetical protein Tco_1348681, partial [Tanacetum coccineum]